METKDAKLGWKEKDALAALQALAEAVAKGAEGLPQRELMERFKWDAPRASHVMKHLEQTGRARREQRGAVKFVLPTGGAGGALASPAVAREPKVEGKATAPRAPRKTPAGEKPARKKAQGVPAGVQEAQARAKAKAAEGEAAADGAQLSVPEKPKPALTHPRTMDKRLANVVPPNVVDAKAEKARAEEHAKDAKRVERNVGKKMERLSEDETLAYNGFLVTRLHEAHAFLEDLARSTKDKALADAVRAFLADARKPVPAPKPVLAEYIARRVEQRVGEVEGLVKPEA